MEVKKSLKILLLPKETFPTFRSNLIVLFDEEMTKRGHVIHSVYKSKHLLKEDEIQRSDNVVRHILASFGNSLVICRMIDAITVFRKLRICINIIEEEEIDIIQVRDGIIEALIGLYLKRRYRIPFCFHLSSLFYYNSEETFRLNKNLKTLLKHVYGRFFERRLYSYLIKHSDIFQPMSRSMGVLFESLIPKEQIFPLPICASESFFLQKRDIDYDVASDKGTKTILYVGKIEPIRKLEFAVHVLKEVERRMLDCNVKLVFVGKCNKIGYIECLKRLAERLGVLGSIEFTGELDYKHIPGVISKANVCISPIPPFKAYIVSSPTKCIEYLSVGVPVVANEEIHDQRDVIEKSGGGFAVGYAKNKFVDAIVYLLSNPSDAHKMGISGKNWIKDNRTYKMLAEGLERNYFNLIR